MHVWTVEQINTDTGYIMHPSPTAQVNIPVANAPVMGIKHCIKYLPHPLAQQLYQQSRQSMNINGGILSLSTCRYSPFSKLLLCHELT